MAVTNKNSNQFILELYRKEHDLVNDNLVFCLMNDTFIFNPATHSTYALISASEIATGFGYTQKTKAMENQAVAIVGGVIVLTCDNPTWTAAGGPIPDNTACCIINTSHVNETVVCCCEYGAIYSTADGKQFQINFSNGYSKGTPNPA